MTAASSLMEVVRAGEELDAAAVSALRARITALAAQGCRAVVVDLSATHRIDSCGLAVLAGTHKRLRGHGGTLVIAAASGAVTRALRACSRHRRRRRSRHGQNPGSLPVTGWPRREPAEPDRTPGGSMRSAARTGRVPVPPLGVYCLASGLAATSAGSAVSLLLAGTARVVTWSAVTAAISIAAGIVYVAAADRNAADAAGDRAGKGCCQ